MAAREGFWLSTHTGKRVYPLDLRSEDFDIRDIAQGLSNACRYAGQGPFYSVAEHSVRGAIRAHRAYGERTALAFLFHDGAEAYVGDAVRPVHELIPDYCTMRDRMQEVISDFFSPGWRDCATEVAIVDNRMLRTEAPMIYRHADKWWEQPRFGLPYEEEFVNLRDRPRIHDREEKYSLPPGYQFWPPRMARRKFLEIYEELKDA